MASVPALDSQTSIRIPRPSRERAQVFGYTLTSDWIADFGRKHDADPTGKKNRFSLIVDSVELVRNELKKDGEYALIRYSESAPLGVPAQIYIARNFGRPMKGTTTRELVVARVEKLKRFLDRTDDPQWMNL